MPNQVISSVENNFTKGLITEFTGLNFPENAATDTDNCIYTIVGNVTRREGIDYEANRAFSTNDRTNKAINTYKWNNAGGDGLTQIVVEQIGTTLFFYRSSSATVSSPISTTILSSIVSIDHYTAGGGTFDATAECQFADGNGYLFVYHPSCDPFYCTYSAGVITANIINLRIRDFSGIQDNLIVSSRPTTLSAEHQYNLVNQGWTAGNAWLGNSFETHTMATGSQGFTIGAGLAGIVNGQFVTVYYEAGGNVSIPSHTPLMSGSVTSYSGSVVVLNLTWVNPSYAGGFGTQWTLVPSNTGYITSWFTAVGNYPSNADVWWYFKNTSNVFDPTTTAGNVTLATGNAPKGRFLFSPFIQDRTASSAIAGLTPVSTTTRPRTGTWFQGRVWYTGVDAQQPATGDASYYTWSENIYFSQVVQDVTQVGNCFQTNDPTSENLNGLLPTDGGVIQIQGCGAIYKLFPIQNALLVFAANGVWYITGSQGIGFAANDYTIVKLSSVKSISGTSVIDVQGLPMFWNEEGIYSVQPASQKGGALQGNPLHVNPLEVTPVTVGTILTFYADIPLQSKKYARGDYDPINYVVQWCYRDTNETDVTSRYQFNRILNFSDYNQSFFPYTVSSSGTYIHGIRYVTGPGGLNTPPSMLKYPASTPAAGSYNFSFAEESSDDFVDWISVDTVGVNYTSYFVTGYRLHGQAQRRFQIPYIYVFSHGDGEPTAYKIQGLWDYASDRNSNRWSVPQTTFNNNPHFGMIFRRHRIRGQGLVLQIKVTSIDGQPFDIFGWSSFETQNTGV